MGGREWSGCDYKDLCCQMGYKIKNRFMVKQEKIISILKILKHKLIGNIGYYTSKVQFNSVQLLSRVPFFESPWTAARQASLCITSSQSLLKLMSIESVMLSNHLYSVVPFSSHLQSFPASGSFQMSQLFVSGGQRIGISASTSVLPMNIQDQFLLGWTGWISLQSKGLS